MASNYAVLVHAGAGYHSRKKESEYIKLCQKACETAIHHLQLSADPVQAATEAVCVLENDQLTNAGYGSNLNVDGDIEMDAGIMSDDGLFGSVGALSRVKNPIRVAQIIHDEQNCLPTDGRIPPCCLSGTGALKFARDRGVEVLPDQSSLISDRCKENYSRYSRIISAHKRKKDEKTDYSNVKICKIKNSADNTCDEKTGYIDEDSKQDTVGVIILYTDKLVTACSSGGVAMKHSGRISQVCVPGAGLWVSKSTAATTSGTGELIMKTCIAKSVCDNLVTCGNEMLACETVTHTIQQQFLGTKAVQPYSKKALGVLCLHKLNHQSAVAIIGFSTDSFTVGYQTSEMNEPLCQIYRNTETNNVNVTGIKLNFSVKQTDLQNVDDIT